MLEQIQAIEELSSQKKDHFWDKGAPNEEKNQSKYTFMKSYILPKLFIYITSTSDCKIYDRNICSYTYDITLNIFCF